MRKDLILRAAIEFKERVDEGAISEDNFQFCKTGKWAAAGIGLHNFHMACVATQPKWQDVAKLYRESGELPTFESRHKVRMFSMALKIFDIFKSERGTTQCEASPLVEHSSKPCPCKEETQIVSAPAKNAGEPCPPSVAEILSASGASDPPKAKELLLEVQAAEASLLSTLDGL